MILHCCYLNDSKSLVLVLKVNLFTIYCIFKICNFNDNVVLSLALNIWILKAQGLDEENLKNIFHFFSLCISAFWWRKR